MDLSPVTNDKYNQSSTAGVNIAKIFIGGVSLSEIDFSKSSTARTDLSAGTDVNTALTDVNNTNSYSLGNISISNNNGFCKKYNLFYSYFYDSHDLTKIWGLNNHCDQYRLCLDSIKEISCTGNVWVPPYKFSYYGRDSVPRTLSFGMDHWGFSNGITNNSDIIPKFTVITSSAYESFSNANRDPAYPAMRAGTLGKITYPTGGYDSLEYEANNTSANYVSWTKSNSLANFALGYDRCDSKQYDFTTGNNSSAHYELDESSSQSGQYGGSGAHIEFNCSGCSYQPSFQVAPGSTKVDYFILSPGTHYTVTTSNSNSSCDAVQEQLYEWTPVTTNGNVMVSGLRIKTLIQNDGITSKKQYNIVFLYCYRRHSIFRYFI